MVDACSRNAQRHAAGGPRHDCRAATAGRGLGRCVVVGFLFMLFVGSSFATLGGLLGAADLPQAAAPPARRRARSRYSLALRILRRHGRSETAREIAALLQEDRTFPPPAEFRAQAHVRGRVASTRAPSATRKRFWAELRARARVVDAVDPVLDWQPPHAKWFVGGKLNASVNCVDRHVRGRAAQQGGDHLGRRAGRPPHADLLRSLSRGLPVRQRAEVARRRKGDRVALYLPLIPELAIAMLACARIGAVHSVVFGGFSAESLRDRINDAQARCSSPPTAATAAARSCR